MATTSKFFLWPCIKSTAYSTTTDAQEELKNRIVKALATIRDCSDSIRNAREIWFRHAECWIHAKF